MALNSNTQKMSERELTANRYKSARANLLLLVVITAVNVFFAATASDTYILFTATIPYYLALEGAFLTGKFPAEYYEPGMEFFPDTVLYVMIAVAVVMTLGYLLCYLCSGKGRYGWMIAALAFFLIDTVAMFLLYGISFDMIMDILFHGYIIAILISGIRQGIKLKNLPVEPLYQTTTASDSNPQI